MERQRVFNECTEAIDCEDPEELQRLLGNMERVAGTLTAAMLGGAAMSGTGKGGGSSSSDSLIERF